MPTSLSPVKPADIFQTLYAPIAGDLAEVERILRREMRSEHSFVDELVRYGCLLGGKRLRPALLLLSAQAAGGRVTQEHHTLAAVVEMIHTATLVHDDVLDEAEMRRHLATVNARWDNEASVLLGDFLFTHAFYLASTLESALACRLIGRATNTVCEGELRQKGSRGDFSLDEREYLGIIEAKTAALTAVSCRLGALYAEGVRGRVGEGETFVEEMDGFGRDLGVAFQIADDLLDVLGEERTTGKSLGTDLEKQKPTLPIVRVLQVATPADRQAVLDILNSDERQPALLAPYLERYEAIEYARERALSFAGRARRRLEGLPRSEARETLAAMAELVVRRSM